MASIRVLKFKVIKATPEQRKRWKHLAQQTKRLVNAMWRIWLVEMTARGNDIKVREYIAANNAWHSADPATRGPKPKCDIKPYDKDLETRIRNYVASIYPDVNIRVLNLLLPGFKAGEGLCKASSKSAYPVWMRVLTDEGEYQNSSRAQPIPFDKCNSDFIEPDTDLSDFQLALRIDRCEVEGRTMATSTRDVLTLQTRGRACSSQTAILRCIVEAEKAPRERGINAEGKVEKKSYAYKFCGSALVFRESTGEWFVHISYQSPAAEPVEVDPNKVAFLRPGVQRPWWLRVDGRKRYVGSRTGRHVAYVRRQLLTDRWGRQETYRYAGSSQKGHGRDRAIKKIFKLQNRWKDFVKTANQQTAKEVIDWCLSQQVGHVIYFQPTDMKDKCFLARAGKVEGRRDSTGWDWHQVVSILAYKCKDFGIKLTVKKQGERLSAEKSQTKSGTKRKPRKKLETVG